MRRPVSHYKEVVLESTYADFYAADHTVMVDYPLRLESAKQGHYSPTIAERSEKYILDSSIGDESIGNAEVVDVGEKLDATHVVPADAFQNPEETTAAIEDMLDRLDQVDYDPEIIVPLQYDEETSHVGHLQAVENLFKDRGLDLLDHRLAVGGVKDDSFIDQLRAIVSVRQAAGSEANIHGFGVGARREWIVTVRRFPNLLDSFDNSRGMKQNVNGNLLDKNLDPVSFKLPRGTNSTFLSAITRELQYYLIAYQLTPFVREEDALDHYREVEDVDSIELTLEEVDQ